MGVTLFVAFCMFVAIITANTAQANPQQAGQNVAIVANNTDAAIPATARGAPSTKQGTAFSSNKKAKIVLQREGGGTADANDFVWA